jgi:hypothetical protein
MEASPFSDRHAGSSERDGAAHARAPVGQGAAASGNARLLVAHLRPAAIVGGLGQEGILPPQRPFGGGVEVRLLRRANRGEGSAGRLFASDEALLAMPALVSGQAGEAGGVAAQASSEGACDGRERRRRRGRRSAGGGNRRRGDRKSPGCRRRYFGGAGRQGGRHLSVLGLNAPHGNGEAEQLNVQRPDRWRRRDASLPQQCGKKGNVSAKGDANGGGPLLPSLGPGSNPIPAHPSVSASGGALPPCNRCRF